MCVCVYKVVIIFLTLICLKITYEIVRSDSLSLTAREGRKPTIHAISLSFCLAAIAFASRGTRSSQQLYDSDFPRWPRVIIIKASLPRRIGDKCWISRLVQSFISI